MFSLIGNILELIYMISLVAFVAAGVYYVFGPKARGAIQTKRTSRGLKFFGLTLALVMINFLFLPMWAAGILAIGADMVAYKRVRNVRYPLGAGGSSQALPWKSTY
jgi:uncharacterized membrane protein required for colicin V production